MRPQKIKLPSGWAVLKESCGKGALPPRRAEGQRHSVQTVIQRLKNEVQTQRLEAEREMEELRKHRGIFGISTSTG